jgi:hypothetical protein
MQAAFLTKEASNKKTLALHMQSLAQDPGKSLAGSVLDNELGWWPT